MDYVSDAPRLDIHHVIQPSKIDNPVEDRSDQDFASGKENLKPSSQSLPESNKENGHADSCVPVQSVECPASDDDEKRAISLEATPHMPSSESATSVEKVHQEPLDTSTAAANASAFERQLESREPPEGIEQRDGGESNLLDPQKHDMKEPELIAFADRGFESAREAIDQIIPSKECSASVQQDLHEANTEAPETGLITEVHTAGTGDTIDHVPEEPLQTQNDPISIAAKEAAPATSDFETHGVEDQVECLANATSLEEGPSEGGHGSSLLFQGVAGLDVPEPASEVDKQADVPDKIPVIETAEETTSCEADDSKTQADEVVVPSAAQSSEVESDYLADVGEKEDPVADKDVVTPEICSFNESAPYGNDRFEEECAGVEISAPTEVNVREMPCDDVKVEDHEVTELTGTQTPAEGISHPLSEEPFKEADLDEPSTNAENDTEISHGIETAIPAIVYDQPNKESTETDQNPTPSELLKEVAAEDVPLAENDDAIESCQVELTPAAAQNEKTDEDVELAKSDPTEENVKGSVSSLDESTPTVSDDYDQTKEYDKVVEPSTPQILEGDRICHANEPVKEDAVEEPLQTESTPAASDVELVQKRDISPPLTEENVSEANISTSESTPTATKDDHLDDDRPHQLKEGVAEDEKLPVNDRSYTVETTTLSGCDGQSVDQKVSNNQKASEDELKSEAMPSSCDGQSLDQKVCNYRKALEDEPKSEAMLHYSPTQKQAEQQSETSDFETGVSESKGIINLDEAQPCTDPSSPNHSKDDGIELSTLDPISHKVQESAPPRDQVQDSAPPPDPQAIGEDTPNVKDSSLPLDALAIGEDNTAVKGETESLVTDREPRGIFEKDGAPKVEAEHGTSEPPHKPSFLGKLIDKVTGKNK